MHASSPRRFAPGTAQDWPSKLRWRLNRLRCMSALEVAHRVARAAAGLAERAGVVGEDAAPRPQFGAPPRPWVQAPPEIDPAPYVAAASRLAEDRFDLFALRDVHLGSPPRWNRDPRNGVEAPLAFGMHLDYRDPRLVGDIKYLWEPNRHLHLPAFAQAWALTGEARWFAALRGHLESWLAACPYRYGPNWSSALEAALRLINWAAAWQLLGGARSACFTDESGVRLRDAWLRSVYQHAEFIRRHLSRFSSANNHLIGEAAGLYLAGLAWPHWTQARRWRTTGEALLEREVLAQNGPDGVNREQATGYQAFVLEMLLLCLVAGKANGHWFSAAYESRVEAMLDFLASITDAGGHVPMFGDADDAVALRLDPDPGFSPPRSLLAAGAVLFRRGDFKLKAGRIDARSRWLLGAQAAAQFEALDAERTRLPLRQTFPDGGYYVLGAEFESAREIRLVADAGPLGYREIAAHGHADALSFTLSVGGREMLVDPGTYAYHTQPEWRAYFRGTAAHNTARVDGVDQSEPGGNFMWLRKARARCTLWSSNAEEDVFEGWHDGYQRLRHPVVHRRTIRLDKHARRIHVDDAIEARSAHDVELHFHCSERCAVEPLQTGYAVTDGPARIVLSLPEGGEHRVVRGATAPILGWISRRFDVKVPAPTIAWRARVSGNAVLRTVIDCA